VNGGGSDVQNGSDPGSGSVHLRYDQQVLPYHRAVASAAARHLPPGGRVLDVGCGVGHVLALLEAARPDAGLHALDVDERCLAITRTRVRELTARPLDLEGLLDEPLPWPVDQILLSHVLEHSRRPADLVERLVDQLPVTGTLVVAVPNTARPTVTIKSALRRDDVNRGHLYSWDRSHWMNLLERVLGLDVVEYVPDYVPIVPERLRARWPGPIGRVEVAAARAVPWWTFSNIAVVRGRGRA
jgi:2-polyprenyl-3-methyl-5-hydroxy-6-metoxy-1,4-benzoquinol methylase